jgi:hypothetical protein
MRHRLKLKAIPVLIPLGLTVWACNYDLGECYLRGTEGTAAGGPYPPGSAATGDWFGNGNDVGSGAAEEMAGCTPDKTCTDMFVDCQEIGGKCITGYPGCDKWGHTPCESCRDACQKETQYPPACKCSSCGFR